MYTCTRLLSHIPISDLVTVPFSLRHFKCTETIIVVTEGGGGEREREERRGGEGQLLIIQYSVYNHILTP